MFKFINKFLEKRKITKYLKSIRKSGFQEGLLHPQGNVDHTFIGTIDFDNELMVKFKEENQQKILDQNRNNNSDYVDFVTGKVFEDE